MGRIPVQVIAHRGASFDYPENTPAAFDAALDLECDGIELDLQLTLDRVPVLYHDKNLARLDLPDRQIADLTLEELRARAAASPFYGPSEDESIPTMDEVLGRFGQRTHLYVEIKTREHGEAGRVRHVELLRRAIAGVRQHGVQSRVSMLSYDRDILGVCAREAPELPRVLNVRPTAGVGLMAPGVPGEIDLLSADIRTLTPEFAASIRAAGFPLLVFVCNDIDQVNGALAMAAIGIMSDRPGWLRQVLSRRMFPQPAPVRARRGDTV